MINYSKEKKDSGLLRFSRVFIALAPIIIFVSVFIHSKLPVNQGEFAENGWFLLLAAIIMFVNLFFVLGLLLLVSLHSRMEKLLIAYSVLFGTPLFLLILYILLEIFTPF